MRREVPPQKVSEIKKKEIENNLLLFLWGVCFPQQTITLKLKAHSRPKSTKAEIMMGSPINGGHIEGLVH